MKKILISFMLIFLHQASAFAGQEIALSRLIDEQCEWIKTDQLGYLKYSPIGFSLSVLKESNLYPYYLSPIGRAIAADSFQQALNYNFVDPSPLYIAILENPKAIAKLESCHNIQDKNTNFIYFSLASADFAGKSAFVVATFGLGGLVGRGLQAGSFQIMKRLAFVRNPILYSKVSLHIVSLSLLAKSLYEVRQSKKLNSKDERLKQLEKETQAQAEIAKQNLTEFKQALRSDPNNEDLKHIIAEYENVLSELERTGS